MKTAGNLPSYRAAEEGDKVVFKVAAPAKMQQQQKSAEKRERKERATERANSARQKEED